MQNSIIDLLETIQIVLLMLKEVPKDIEIEYYKLFVKAKPKKPKEKTEDVRTHSQG